MTELLSRRGLIALMATGTAAAVAACGASPRPPAADREGGAGARSPDVRAMHVYRDPECGCCEAWADIARKAGYQVTVENRADH